MKLTRRNFIQTTTAVAGASMLSATQTATAGEFSGKIKKAVKFGMIKEKLSVLDKLKLLKDIGFEGVEPGVRDGIDAKELRKASEKTGIKVHGVVNGSVNRIDKAVDYAKEVGATSVLLVAGGVSNDSYYAENWAKTQKIIKDAIPYAKEQNIRLLVENVWNDFLITPTDMARYIDELNDPIIGVYFDPGNTARYGYPQHWIPVLGDRIVKLDIKPFSRKRMMDEGPWAGFKMPIGEGDIDWALVRKELKAINYTGWATAEVPGADRKGLADIAARMDKILDI